MAGDWTSRAAGRGGAARRRRRASGRSSRWAPAAAPGEGWVPVGALGDPRGPLADRIAAVGAALGSRTGAGRRRRSRSRASRRRSSRRCSRRWRCTGCCRTRRPPASTPGAALAPGGRGPVAVVAAPAGRRRRVPGSRRPRCPASRSCSPRSSPPSGRRSAVAERVLWGNAASSVASARQLVAAARPDAAPRAAAVGRHLLTTRTVRGHGDAARPRTARRRLDLPAPLVLPLLPGPGRRDLRRLRAAPAGPPNPAPPEIAHCLSPRLAPEPAGGGAHVPHRRPAPVGGRRRSASAAATHAAPVPRSTHREEHRRAPEPDARPHQRRGAVRRAQARLRPGVPEDRPAGPDPRLPAGQGAGPHPRGPPGPRRGARRGRQRRRSRPSTPRPSRPRTTSPRSAARTSRSPRSPTATSSPSPPRSTSARRSRCPTSTRSRSRWTTSRSTDADVTEELDNLRARFGTLTGVERPAGDDDFVLHRPVGRPSTAQPVEEATTTGFSYQVGQGGLIDGIDEAIARPVGRRVGDLHLHAGGRRVRRPGRRGHRRPSRRSRSASCPTPTTSSPSSPASSTPSTS